MQRWKAMIKKFILSFHADLKLSLFFRVWKGDNYIVITYVICYINVFKYAFHSQSCCCVVQLWYALPKIDWHGG